MIAGVVLAGGRSTRFGSEKAVAPVDGEPMIARVAAVLARDMTPVAVNAPEGGGAAAWANARRLPVLPDPAGAPDGPLAGVLAGLVWAEAGGFELLATAPCDTPWLPPDMVVRLQIALGDAPAAVAVTAGGSHPLCAVWRTTLRRALEAELANDHPSVREWLARIGAAEVRFPDPHAFSNFNTPPVRLSLFRVVLAGAVGMVTALAAGIVSQVLFALAVPRLWPCRAATSLCGGDTGPYFLWTLVVIPTVAIAMGALAAFLVMRRR